MVEERRQWVRIVFFLHIILNSNFRLILPGLLKRYKKKKTVSSISLFAFRMYTVTHPRCLNTGNCHSNKAYNNYEIPNYSIMRFTSTGPITRWYLKQSDMTPSRVITALSWRQDGIKYYYYNYLRNCLSLGNGLSAESCDVIFLLLFH